MPRETKYNSYRNSTGSSTRRKSRKRKKKQSNAPIILGLGVIAVLLVILGGILFKGKGRGPEESGEDHTETTMAEETKAPEKEQEIWQNVVIDLSSIYNSKSGISDDNRIYVQGMTAEEISKAISEKYEWSLAMVNDDAKVGTTVKPQADINQTTEAATLGDAENPDSNSSGESVYSEISVSNEIPVPDYIAERIPAFVENIMQEDKDAKAVVFETETETEEETTEEKKPFWKKSKEEETTTEAETETTEPMPEVVYTFALDDLEDEVSELVSYAANMWYVEPLGGSIGSYDASTDKFLMENARSGFDVDEEKLLADVRSAISDRNFTAKVPVSGTVLSAEDSAHVSGAYTTLATYTTNTTSNSVRNQNIKLACQKLNGTIVRPGEEFSFNNTVGQRTKEKGFGEAAAYNNGEVVQEVGGGVCQVSTTLYNAVVKAGLKITARQSHTFKPSYVTPGQDATISWGGPDFRFANLPSIPKYSYDTSHAIGIRASYHNQTVTVAIYGRPVLKDGISYSLSSVQTKTIEKVRQLIEPGSDKTPTNGSEGSVWETRLVIKKNGEVISNDVDHNALYSGHIEYYTDQTETETSETESTAEGVITDAPVLPQGPGGELTNGPGVYDPSSVTAGPGADTDTDAPDGPIISPGVAETTTAASETSAQASPVVSSDSPGSASSGSASPGSASPGSSDSSGSTSTDSPGSSSTVDVSNGPVISSDGPGSITTTDTVTSNGPGM